MALAVDAGRNFQLVAITPCALARRAFAHESISTFGVHTRRMHEGAHDVLTFCNQLRLVAHALPRSRTAYLVDGRFRLHAVGRRLDDARNRRSRERLLLFCQCNFDSIAWHAAFDEDGLPFRKVADCVRAVCHSFDYDGMVHGGVNPLLQIDCPLILAYNHSVASPWHSWIARLPPEQKAVGSNPAGDARKTTDLATAGSFHFRWLAGIRTDEVDFRPERQKRASGAFLGNRSSA